MIAVRFLMSLPPTPPPLGPRLVRAGSSITIRIVELGERVKVRAGDGGRTATLIFCAAGALKREQSDTGEVLGIGLLYYAHLRAEKRRPICLRHGQLRSEPRAAFTAHTRMGEL